MLSNLTPKLDLLSLFITAALLSWIYALALGYDFELLSSGGVRIHRGPGLLPRDPFENFTGDTAAV